jgi:soluble lytic murein transglycosylase
MPYRAIIDQFSRKYDVNKNLLYAIIQAESGFLENAVSFRGAIGLMQMMPFVAHDLAARLTKEPFDREQLKNPQVAIELGALFVATLGRQFSDPHLVVAAYNAGPHQVQKWLDLFGHLPTELFVERIPFKQTRDYIKIVLPSEGLYNAMTGKNLRLLL